MSDEQCQICGASEFLLIEGDICLCAECNSNEELKILTEKEKQDKSEIQQLRQQVEELKGELLESNRLLSADRKQIFQLGADLTALRKENEAYASDNKKLLRLFDELESQLSTIKAECATLREAVKVAVVGLWNHYRSDTEKVFSRDELKEIVESTRHIDPNKPVENIFKEALSTPLSSNHEKVAEAKDKVIEAVRKTYPMPVPIMCHEDIAINAALQALDKLEKEGGV